MREILIDMIVTYAMLCFAAPIALALFDVLMIGYFWRRSYYVKRWPLASIGLGICSGLCLVAFIVSKLMPEADQTTPSADNLLLVAIICVLPVLQCWRSLKRFGNTRDKLSGFEALILTPISVCAVLLLGAWLSSLSGS